MWINRVQVCFELREMRKKYMYVGEMNVGDFQIFVNASILIASI